MKKKKYLSINLLIEYSGNSSEAFSYLKKVMDEQGAIYSGATFLNDEGKHVKLLAKKDSLKLVGLPEK